MSLDNRDYMKDRSGGGVGGPATWSVITWLLVINIGVYVLNNLILFNPDRDLFGLSLGALQSFRVWTPLTYQFVHGSLWHLLANMLGLFFLGRMLLSLVRPSQVLWIYLLGGFAGGALQLIWNAIFGDAIIIGASGSVLAIVFALATLIPYQRIQLLLFFILPISLTLRQVAWISIAANVLTLILGLSAGGAEVAVMAHFGGMLWGWLHIRFRFHEEAPVRIIRSQRQGPRPDKKPRPKKPYVNSDVDAILDKINAEGFQSLTPEERRILDRRSNDLSRRIEREN